MKTSLATRLGCLLACTGLVLGVAACGSSSSSGTAQSSSTSKKPTIAFIGCIGTSSCTSVLDATQPGAKAANANVTFIGSQITSQGFLSACQDAISSGKYQGIVFMSLIPSAGVPCAAAASQHHLPLVTTFGPIGSNLVQGQPTVAGVTSQVMLPDATQANAMVSMVPVACAKHDPCQVLWERAAQGEPSLDAMIGSALNSLTASHPDIKVVGQADTEFNESPAITDTQQLLEAHPATNVILTEASQAGSAALQVLGSNLKQVAILSAGCGSVQLQEIRAKKLYGCNVWLAQTEAEEAIKLVAEAAEGQKIPSYVNPLQVAGNLPAGIDQANIASFPDFLGQFQQ
jgi:ribose transport system substrate-binding protein